MTTLTDSSYPFEFIGISTVGADNRDNPDGAQTRRYRVYKAYIKRLGLEEQFETVFFDQQSFVVLVNKRAVTDVNEYSQRLLEFI